MNTYIHVAAYYAIFTAPVKPGNRGYALLSSLLLNTREPDGRADLLSLHQADAIELVQTDKIDGASIARSLQERGVPRDHISQSVLHHDDRTYIAVVVEARAATADTVRDHAIYCMRGWLVGRVDAAADHLRHACAVALGEKDGDLTRQAAREFCAQQWNHRAGVLC